MFTKKNLLTILLFFCFFTGCRSRQYRRSDALSNKLAEADTCLKQNKLYRAIQLYNSILKKNPFCGRAFLGLGRIALKHGDYISAIIPLEKALNTSDLGREELEETRILLGKSYHRSGRSMIKAWENLYPAWQRGGRDTKDLLASEISILANKVPASTPGVSRVLDYYGSSPTPAIPPSSNPLGILPRSAWKPIPTINKKAMTPLGKPTMITIHHSAHSRSTVAEYSGSAAKVGELIRSIQKYHMLTNGWLDIGYHYIIGPRGRIWEGRPIKYQGAHAGGHHGRNNKHNIGIVVIGNFCIQKPSSLQIKSLKKLVSWLCKRYGISRHRIYGHCDLDGEATKCPGKYLHKIIKTMN